MNGFRGAGTFTYHTQTQEKTTATMVTILLPIHHERPPHPERPPQRGAVYLISGLRGTFCGSAAVVDGSGDECGRFVVADTAIYSV